MAERTLVTSALPYANGPIHLGHAVEYIQTDIYVRFLRSCGKDVVYFCADDTHGTPIELNAAKQGLKPEEFIARFQDEHQKDFHDLDVRFDYFHSTNSPENRHYAELIYGKLKEQGDIERRDIEQTYCEKDRRFLPDRFIKGTCPNCKATDQYGDACEKCGKAYSPTDLIEPRCALCGTPPVRKSSEHLFFKLSRHADFLQAQLKKPGFLHPGLAAQLQGFFEKGLADWDISRDGPYFGFAIPGETDKYFYVWLDAPIGYIATTEKWAKETGKAKSALDYWAKDSGARIVHFIGKDIVYFHALFWPAVLEVAGLHVPNEIKVHGHLTLNGEKMSKTRGNFVSARDYLKQLDPSYLRYFYAANLGSGVEDLDLNLKDFRLRVNGELVNNVGNLANRALSLLAGPLGGTLAPGRAEGAGRALVESVLARVPEVREAFEKLEYRNAIRVITDIASAANAFVQAQAPWALVKKDAEAARADLSDAADVVYLLGALLAPVTPRLSEKLFAQLGAQPLTFQALEGAKYPLLDRSRPIGTPEPLLPRLEEDRVNAILEAAIGAAAPAAEVKKAEGGAKEKKAEKKPAEAAPAPSAAPAAPAASGEIEYADFAKVVLKSGKVLAAEKVPKADKLLKLSVDVGEATGPRTIVSGIAEAFAPESLVGRNVVVVANLKPRSLKGIESRGMLLTAGPGGKDLSLLDPGNVPPGSDVK
ncbi:methionyl-tRNA synthetase [Myxococcus stipitatus DSM 14675]|uniref:Methionine--tRNA ligase n=1 Tax=Myxococcus stipitatus (strain DSM 14675 / JCM 12634 / Mx s8) TaxID=1278073 RepID=L7U9L7_MYXSD|nr:methionine--tRNA ligase [Myxococcus stipitatus]AGC44540.1 methionyl-tRNA synthetase [Myxococcus stipitatus DSM 14675]